MKKSLCSLLLLWSVSTNAQEISTLLKDTYGDNLAPGIAMHICSDEKQLHYAQGYADLKTNRIVHAQTQFRLASVSKQFTAMAIYQLIRQGSLSFETPIRQILPELPVKTTSVQIKHILQHSSGLIDYESYIPDNQLDQVSDKDVLKILSQHDSVYFEAGSQFRYSNSGYCLLALIVERVSKQAFDAYCEQHIFHPLQMTHALVYKPTDRIYERAYGYHPNQGTYGFADQSLTSATQGDGGIYMSVEAYSHWATKSNPLIDTQYLADLDKYKVKVYENIYYSLGWFLSIDDSNNLYLFHSGESTGFHNIVLINYTQDKSIVAFSNRDDLKIASLFSTIAEKEFFSFHHIAGQPLFNWLSTVYANTYK